VRKFRQIQFLGLLLVGIHLLVGCKTGELLSTIAITPSATFKQIPLPTQKPNPKEPGEWEQLQPGLERRILDIIKEGEHWESLYILRLEPDYFQFGVAYEPQGLALEAWQEQTNALIIVNGGYFWQEGEQYFPNGLTVIDGTPMGASYDDFGGMFAVTENGPQLRWLANQPYDPSEQLLSALQSFPILVKPGGEMGFSAEHEDNLSARRTVIAQDREGRILLMIAPGGNLTLHQLSAYLTSTDLNLEIAINLDGGPSSGILLAEPHEKIPAIWPLPIVIIISEP
jgi:hypothetical protein